MITFRERAGWNGVNRNVELVTEKRFRETNFGVFQGKTMKEALALPDLVEFMDNWAFDRCVGFYVIDLVCVLTLHQYSRGNSQSTSWWR